jgi:hypothetical protein
LANVDSAKSTLCECWCCFKVPAGVVEYAAPKTHTITPEAKQTTYIAMDSALPMLKGAQYRQKELRKPTNGCTGLHARSDHATIGMHGKLPQN